jgi:hypothetical protein
VDPYIHSPIRFHGVLLNYVKRGNKFTSAYLSVFWVTPANDMEAIPRRLVFSLPCVFTGDVCWISSFRIMSCGNVSTG